MQEKHLYEYAVIRVVPLIEREEFINVGIILFCKKEKYISLRFTLSEEKLKVFCKETDIAQVKLNLESFEKIALGKEDGGPIAAMDLASRFRWLTAVRSSVIQTSKVHAGLCNNLDETTQRLFEEQVM